MAEFLFDGDVTELTLRATKTSFAIATRILADNLDYRKLVIVRNRAKTKAVSWGIADADNEHDQTELAELLQRKDRMSKAYKDRREVVTAIIREKHLLPEDRLQKLIA
jgi:hypothetical protein